MVHTRFTSFLLGLLFVMHALRNSSAYSHPGEEGLEATRKNFGVQKGLLDGVDTAGLKKIGLGGRKMAVHKVLMSKEIEKQHVTTSEISGKDTDASKKPLDCSQYKVNVQNNLNKLEPKSSKSASFRIPRSKPAQPQNSQDSKAASTKASLESSSRSDNKPAYLETNHTSQRDHEARWLLQATKEIVNLMHKDYKGMGRRKPPINNHEPWH
ncbi:uncharacterized protein LOC111985691 [Quercus suber]|uniref:uncharacterized protein LOC111985691 n=1 Tax=Quercus suber TaxID=58331 RepID=UPI0032DE4CE0